MKGEWYGIGWEPLF